MNPEFLWDLMVGTTTVDPITNGAATKVARRAMPHRLRELLNLQPEQWKPEDHLMVNTIRDLANVLMRGPLLDPEAAELGFGLGATKELMVCLAAFSQNSGSPGGVSGEENTLTRGRREIMLSRLRIL
ncbi:hypothetical protein [Burkholderia sp. MBR-1]|uniref:hypothetical protein n=1 Tax=Burkholderia sp. MBR-1 TaxID=2732364 RepID=UPI0015EF8FD1|nr:hypothetical protein [Burkholderia sp. MBR-1]QMI49932.1 hypothetical protein MBR110_31230 [Burkholderia sp. MBR-1]